MAIREPLWRALCAPFPPLGWRHVDSQLPPHYTAELTEFCIALGRGAYRERRPMRRPVGRCGAMRERHDALPTIEA